MVSDDGRNLLASVRWDATNLFGTEFFLIQLRDITEHRQLLTASELRFSQLAASLPDSAIFMFDHDLRLLLVLGEAIRANGYDPAAMTGRLLNEVFAQDVVDLLEEPVPGRVGRPSRRTSTTPARAAGGNSACGCARSPAPTTRSSAALAVNEDVSADRARQTAAGAGASAEQPGQLLVRPSHRLGVRSGTAGPVGGRRARTNRLAAVADLVLAQDRPATAEQWTAALTLGGRCSTPYRIHHGRTGQIRHLQSTYEAVVDAEHTLVRAVATHVDVTAVVAASENRGRPRSPPRPPHVRRWFGG